MLIASLPQLTHCIIAAACALQCDILCFKHQPPFLTWPCCTCTRALCALAAVFPIRQLHHNAAALVVRPVPFPCWLQPYCSPKNALQLLANPNVMPFPQPATLALTWPCCTCRHRSFVRFSRRCCARLGCQSRKAREAAARTRRQPVLLLLLLVQGRVCLWQLSHVACGGGLCCCM
jgi:hypothetical protein